MVTQEQHEYMRTGLSALSSMLDAHNLNWANEKDLSGEMVGNLLVNFFANSLIILNNICELTESEKRESLEDFLNHIRECVKENSQKCKKDKPIGPFDAEGAPIN